MVKKYSFVEDGEKFDEEAKPKFGLSSLTHALPCSGSKGSSQNSALAENAPRKLTQM